MFSRRTRQRAWEILEKAARPDDRASRGCDIFIISLIVANVLAVVLETEPGIHERFSYFFLYFEIASVFLFSLEYAARLWACTAEPRFAHPLWGRVRFAVSPLALVDLLAILPFYFYFIHIDTRFLRSIRLLRLFRLFKLGRYSESFQTLANVLQSKKEELAVNFFILFILLVSASSLMYFVEHETQPRAFASIPAAMWWGVATLTTVGYGDVTPVTPAGRVLGGVLALLGIAMFALPTGILAAGFHEEMQRRRRPGRGCCPHCGADRRAAPPVPASFGRRSAG